MTSPGDTSSSAPDADSTIPLRTAPVDLPPIPILPPLPAQDNTIPLAAPILPEPAPVSPPPKATRKPKAPRRDETPILLWPPCEEFPERRPLVAITLLAFLGLYAWFLSFYYAGATGAVDASGYLTTARLIAGYPNIDAPTSIIPIPAPSASATSPSAATPDKSRVWSGPPYTKDHPAPTPLQLNPRFDVLRNRFSFIPESPFQFVGRMFIITEPFGPAIPSAPAASPSNAAAEQSMPPPPATASAAAPAPTAQYRAYAKYPPGYPLLAALARTLAAPFDHTTRFATPAKSAAARPITPPASPGKSAALSQKSAPAKSPAVAPGFAAMYLISPLATVLAVAFAYLLFRQVVSPFTALIGTLWLAFNPLVLAFAHGGDSHAPTLCCVTLGFYGLLSFLRTRQNWQASIAGLALGYACTIRYSEFLLLLPLGFAALIHFRPTARRAAGVVSLLTAWAMPVATLAFFCWICFGSPFKTGYSYCNEDTGFGWKYLSGNYGDRTLTGNWQTFLSQINHMGLFILWPFALAGLFGLLGAAWRLGTLLALWVFPSLLLYLLYYFAPGGDSTLVYLRFFISILPALILAALWMLERALSTLYAEKKPALIIATLLALALFLTAAIYLDGGPAVIEGGLAKTLLGLIAQLPHALAHLLSSLYGIVAAILMGLLIASIWLIDEELIPTRLPIALGAGAITALGCAMNVSAILPQLDSTFVRWSTLRTAVDNLRETLPEGTVIFSDDNLLNQLDCLGGWKLYDTAYFSTAMYQQAKNAVAQRGNPDQQDPDPIQVSRSRFYVELLTNPVTGAPRTQAEILQLEKNIIDQNLAQGHRVTFLTLADPGDLGGVSSAGGRISLPTLSGYTKTQLRKWITSPAPSIAAKAGPSAKPTANQGPTYILWELKRTADGPPAS